MSFTSKIEVGAPQVKKLQELIEAGKSIEGDVLVNFPCLGCKNVLKNARVTATGVHKAKCLWNYCVHCPECGYQSSLAKFIIDYQCRCE